jgi:UDP-glucuronate 4-epimerase
LKERNLALLQSKSASFTSVRGDITRREQLDELLSAVRFDQVLHLAARAGVRSSLEDPALYQRVNVEGTVNLLESARLHGVQRSRWPRRHRSMG